MPAGIGAVTVWPSGVSQRSRRRRITCGRSTSSWTRKSSQPLKREPAGTSAAMTRSSWMVRRPILGAFTPRPRPVSAGSGPVPFSMPLGLTLGRPFTPLSVATSARSAALEAGAGGDVRRDDPLLVDGEAPDLGGFHAAAPARLGRLRPGALLHAARPHLGPALHAFERRDLRPQLSDRLSQRGVLGQQPLGQSLKLAARQA